MNGNDRTPNRHMTNDEWAAMLEPESVLTHAEAVKAGRQLCESSGGTWTALTAEQRAGYVEAAVRKAAEPPQFRPSAPKPSVVRSIADCSDCDGTGHRVVYTATGDRRFIKCECTAGVTR